MRKILLIALILFVSSFRAYGAEPESQYVRKDVFEAYMQTINTKFDRILSELSSLKTEMKTQREEVKADIAGLKSELKAQRDELTAFKKEVNDEFTALRKDAAVLAENIRGLNNSLAQHIRESENRITDIRNDVYLGLVVLGIIFIIKEFFTYFRERDDSRQAVTLEDVKKLIEEAKLGSKTNI